MNKSALARMAGNICAGLVARKDYESVNLHRAAEHSVELAELILAYIDARHPDAPVERRKK